MKPPFVSIDPADDAKPITGYYVKFETLGRPRTYRADTIGEAFYLQEKYAHLGTSTIVPEQDKD